MRTKLLAAVSYFGLVFAAGFVLGTIRVLFLVPRLGERTAELSELPFMLTVIYFSARIIVNRFRVISNSDSMLLGLLALLMLVLVEFTMVLGLRGLSVEEYFASRDPVAFMAYVLGLAAFALTPLIVQTLRAVDR